MGIPSLTFQPTPTPILAAQVASIHPGVAPTDHFGIDIEVPATNPRDHSVIPILIDRLELDALATYQRIELDRRFASTALVVLRGINAIEPNTNPAARELHDESIAIDDASDCTNEHGMDSTHTKQAGDHDDDRSNETHPHSLRTALSATAAILVYQNCSRNVAPQVRGSPTVPATYPAANAPPIAVQAQLIEVARP
jgi:hypothetical protein